MGDSEYPVLHPKSQAYDNYWMARTEECLYGLWGDDSRKESEYSLKPRIGGYRWLPGNMVFHTQHCIIEIDIEGQKAKGRERPRLRGVEWLVGYDLAACDGFAGYTDDKTHTAFRPIQKLELGKKVTHSEKMLIDQYADYLIDPRTGKFKKYKDARELMYETHDEPLGKPLWLNESQNYMLLSTRRLGKSYIVINGIAVYEFVFNGARTLDEFLDQKTSTTTVVGSGVSDKTKEFFAKWHVTYNHLRENVGAYVDGSVNETGAWWWKYEGSVRKENDYMTNAVKIQGQGGYTGPGSRLWHVSFGSSASKGAGTSLNNAIIEEVGLTDNVEDVHGENKPAHQSNYKFGKSVYIGTGGDFKKIEGSRKMFYQPEAFDLLQCQNLWVPGGRPTARFIPATYSRNQFLDENGNQDIQKALEDLMEERDIIEKNDTKQYLRHKASYPITPDEIFVKYDGNSYPVRNLEARKDALKAGALAYSVGRIAFYDSQNTDAYWIEDLEATPLMDLDDLTDDNVNKQGAIVQYEPPNDDKPARRYNDRNPMYMVFVEPVRNDTGSSYFYCYVWKFDDFANPNRMQHNIVMEWFGRIDNNNDKNLKIAFAMAAYYNCNIYAEINNDRIRGLSRDMKKYEWLQPWLGKVEGLEVNSQKDYDVGFYVAPGMIPGLEILTNEMVRQQVTFTEEIRDETFIRNEVMMADVLNSRMVCSQLIAYNREGNYDAHDGFRLLAVWYAANKKSDDQYKKSIEEKKLLEVMRNLQRSRQFGRRPTRSRF
jgi:hypothetical protein